MSGSGVLASFHYVALALGCSALFVRGAALGRIVAAPECFTRERGKVLTADTAYGIAAVLWILTGLARAFGGFEKGSDYYLANPLFWVKLALFGGVFLMELPIMIELIRWRIQTARQRPVAPSPLLAIYARINSAELVFVGLIVFVASQMARLTLR